MSALSPADLRKILRCDPETGDLIWLQRPESLFSSARSARSWNAKFANKPALTANDGNGYLRGNIHNKPHRAHRVIWALVHGEWPKGEIDHINGNREDNRLANLRDVSHAENGRNIKIPSNNKTGVIGVYVQTGRYRVQIRTGDSTIYLGTFDTMESAISARKAADVRFGFHENHGRP